MSGSHSLLRHITVTEIRPSSQTKSFYAAKHQEPEKGLFWIPKEYIYIINKYIYTYIFMYIYIYKNICDRLTHISFLTLLILTSSLDYAFHLWVQLGSTYRKKEAKGIEETTR